MIHQLSRFGRAGRWLLWLSAGAVVATAVASLVIEVGYGARPPLGFHSDFLAFYSAGYLALHGLAGHLYDSVALTHIQRTIVPHPVGAAGYMAYINPPFLAVLLSPLALLAEPQARMVWLGLNVVLMGLIAIGITGGLKGQKRVLAALLLIGTFPLYHALAEGQLSLLLLAGGLVALWAARRERYLFCGSALGVLWIKPQLAVAVLIGLLIFRAWRVVLGMVGTIVGLILLTLPFTGFAIYGRYGAFLSGTLASHLDGAGAAGTSIWHGALNLTEGLNGFFAALLGQRDYIAVDLLSAGVAISLLTLYVFAVRRVRPGLGSADREILLVGSIMLLLLLDLHLFAQDLVLLYILVPILAVRLRDPLWVFGTLFLVLNLSLLDQWAVVRFVTVVLTCVTILICLLTIREGSTRRLLGRIGRGREVETRRPLSPPGLSRPGRS